MIRTAFFCAALLALPTIARAQTTPCTPTGYLKCGNDDSANKPAVPITGYVLIATVPATSRAAVEIDNQSTDLIEVVRDDGAGNNVSIVMLAGASVAGGQGGGWASQTFWGRIRVYAPSSTDQVAVYQE